MKKPTRAQHFVQRAYLAGFCDQHLNDGMRKPFLRVFSPEMPMKRRTPETCAVKKWFYCFDQDGKRSFAIEEILSEMESASSAVLDGARKGRLPSATKDRLTLAGYIALSMVRTPTAKKIVDQAYIDHQMERFRALIDTPGQLEVYLQEHEQKTGIRRDAAEDRRKLKGGRIRVSQTNHAWSLRMMFAQLSIFQRRIMSMHWTLLQSNAAFLTSDNPVILYSPRDRQSDVQRGRMEPDLIFPISRQFCLIGSASPVDHYAVIDDDQTKLINIASIKRAERFVYSPFDALYIQEELDETHALRMKTMKSDSIQL